MAAPFTTPTWMPLLLKILSLTTDLLSRPPGARLRLLAGNSETNRALVLFRLRLQPQFDQAADGFRTFQLHILTRDPLVN